MRGIASLSSLHVYTRGIVACATTLLSLNRLVGPVADTHPVASAKPLAKEPLILLYRYTTRHLVNSPRTEALRSGILL